MTSLTHGIDSEHQTLINAISQFPHLVLTVFINQFLVKRLNRLQYLFDKHFNIRL